MAVEASHPALARLVSFFEAMNAWGWDVIQADERLWSQEDLSQEDNDQFKLEYKRRLGEIFLAHCEAGVAAKRLRDEGLSFGGDEPDYSVDGEIILDCIVAENKVTVITQQLKGMKLIYKYEIICIAGEWKIRDNKKCKIGIDEKKWKTDIL